MGSAVEGKVSVCIPDRDIERASGAVKEFFSSEFGRDYPDWVIAGTVRNWLERRAEEIGEGLGELLTTPGRAEAVEFRKMLEETAANIELLDRELLDAKAAADSVGDFADAANVFTGNRVFSFEKLAAMSAYIAAHGREIYKTKLNKLLFYADFINYYLHGSSISGSRYVHLPYGPVPDRYESMIANLQAAGTIRIDNRQGYELIDAGPDPLTDKLTREERETLDWVLENFGNMSAGAISEMSHRELAYRFTRSGEDIAYEYAKFFEKLPQGS